MATYHMLANQLSEISVSDMTIRFDTPAQKHISVRRLNEEVNRIVRRVTDVDVYVVHVHAVHFALRRRSVVLMEDIWLHYYVRAIRTTLLHADSQLMHRLARSILHR